VDDDPFQAGVSGETSDGSGGKAGIRPLERRGAGEEHANVSGAALGPGTPAAIDAGALTPVKKRPSKRPSRVRTAR